MIRTVIDASVVVKWIFPERSGEQDTGRAVELLRLIRSGRVEVVQPVHWLVEVAAVMARLRPELAPEAVSLLYAMEFPVVDEPEIYVRACDLAAELDQHVFDTLYHAVALSAPDTTLITADDRYFRGASKRGRIERLADFRFGDPSGAR